MFIYKCICIYRYSYDPDELDDEQREREMRKRLNLAFKDFCQKVEKVAAHYDINLMIDVPFKKSGICNEYSYMFHIHMYIHVYLYMYLNIP
jgi:nucleosome binding factor SPN SPT16 subunit